MPRAQVFGRCMVTTCMQPTGAPLVDRAFTRETVEPFREFKSRAILLTPWRKNKWGEHKEQRALVLGWRTV